MFYFCFLNAFVENRVTCSNELTLNTFGSCFLLPWAISVYSIELVCHLFFLEGTYFACVVLSIVQSQWIGKICFVLLCFGFIGKFMLLDTFCSTCCFFVFFLC